MEKKNNGKPYTRIVMIIIDSHVCIYELSAPRTLSYTAMDNTSYYIHLPGWLASTLAKLVNEPLRLAMVALILDSLLLSLSSIFLSMMSLKSSMLLN